MNYCLGFAFDVHGIFVTLIRKNKPAWQKGLLNGVGGKIEIGETPVEAMSREFREETGLIVAQDKWTPVTEMRFRTQGATGCGIFCFAAYLYPGAVPVSTTDEIVGVFTVQDVMRHPKIIPNLRWLVPMALRKLEGCPLDEVPSLLDHG